MSELHPARIEVTPAENIRILARPPLLSSQPLQWQGLYMQAHHQPAWKTPEYSYTQHMLLIHTTKQVVQAERLLDGRRQTEQLVNGSVAIVPATAAHQVSWNQENTFALLFLEPDQLAQVAHETVNGDRVELMPQFAMPDPLIHTIGQALQAEMAANGLGSRLFVDSLTTALSIHLLRHYSMRQPFLRNYSDGLSPPKLQQAIEYIQAYLAEDLSLESIARAVDMSQYYFARLFKQSMGIAPYQYVIGQRVERAKQLLQQPELSIADIALQCGFASQSHLNYHFKRLIGVTPNQSRKK